MIKSARIFNLFRRKAEPAAKQQLSVPRANPPSNADHRAEVIGRCVERFIDHGTFAGAPDAAPGYRAQVMPKGMQVAANRDERIGVVLDTPSFDIAAAGVRAMDMTVVSASGYFRNFRKHEPKWQFRHLPDGSVQMHADVPFGLCNIIRMTCKQRLVDMQFDGRNDTGCTLVVTVVPKV